MNIKIFGHCFVVASVIWSLFITTLPVPAMAQTTNDKPMTAEECSSGPDSPYQWDSERNRCMLKAESSGMREFYEQCDEMEDNSQKAQCFEKLRNQALNKDGMDRCRAQHNGDPEAMQECMSNIQNNGTGMQSDFEDKDFAQVLGFVVDGAITAIGIAAMINGIKPADWCTSAKIMVATGAAGMLAHAHLKMTAKGDFDKIEENYDAQVAAGDDAQFAAYDYLIAQQNEIKNIADKHKSRYQLISLGYAAASVIATIELTTSWIVPCVSSGMILSFSGAGFFIYNYLSRKADDQKEKAGENVELVTNLKTKLEESLNSSNYCSTRDDLSRPRCYCYMSDGSRNTQRSRSETCLALWANHDRNLFAESSDYGGDKKNKASGCYAIDGRWDPECKCREKKDESGKNGCYQVPVGVNEIAAMSPASGVPNVIDSLNKMYSGGFTSGDLKPSQINQLAARVIKAKEVSQKALDKKLAEEGKGSVDKQIEGVLKDLNKKLTPAKLAEARSTSSPVMSSAVPMSKNPAIAEAIKKTGINVANISRPVIRNNKKAVKKAGFDLYGKEEKATDKFMDKKYDYAAAAKNQNDIVEREDVSIWQVISNRYTSTGLSRLFDDAPEEL